MAKAGRKRRQGKRTPGGQLSRAGKPKGETLAGQPSEWVKAQKTRYGSYYNSAIGRAFASGLLGDGNEAKTRLDNARKFASLHRRIMGGDFYRCPLNDAPRGSNDDEPESPTEQDIANHAWLLKGIVTTDESGGRIFMDQLLSRQFTDYGPPWLDRLLNTLNKDRRDTIVLDAALMAIDTLEDRKAPALARILVVRSA